MIHKNGITCKLIQLKNVSDRFLFDQASENVRLNDCVCPCCTLKGQFRQITSYHRAMISVHAGHREETSVPVKRAVCMACGHTQALLPDILIPFSSYSIRFILTVLTEYFHRSCTVADLCGKWQIAVSTLYEWIHLFQRHSAAWARALGQMVQASRNMLSHISDTPSFPLYFWKSTGFFFLQSSAKTRRFSFIHNSGNAFFSGIGYDGGRCTLPAVCSSDEGGKLL